MSDSARVLVPGLLSSTILLVDETKQVYDDATNIKFFPETFREAAAQLPLVRSVLGPLAQYIHEGYVSEDSWGAMSAVLEDCQGRVKKLYDLFREVASGDGWSINRRYYLAVKALGKGNRVEELMLGVLKDTEILTAFVRVDINSRDEHGQTALHHAAEKGVLEDVKNLINKGADINARDEYGRTALYLAAHEGAFDVVVLLLRQGADATIATLEGETARDLVDKKGITRLLDDPPVFNVKPSAMEGAQAKQLRPLPPIDKDQQDVCKKTSTFIRYFSGSKRKEYTVPVFDLIYEGKKLDADEARQLFTPKADEKKEITSKEHDKLPDRWIHLPANNVRVLVLG
jgi:N-terminal domain on NACHT_NTPase and P-loop NTPases/Ankyrin repeats (3 copies)